MTDGFIRAACATPYTTVAGCDKNAGEIIRLAHEAVRAGAKLVAFPELCVTGYTCGDLFLQRTLLQSAEAALVRILKETERLDTLIVVGLPVPSLNALFNCAAVACRGRLLALVPKRHIPNYSEFYEARHFSPGSADAVEIEFAGRRVPLGGDVVFRCETMPSLRIGVEICEDLWVPSPPSERLAIGGATVIMNPSASDEVVGKADFRRTLVKAQSARLISAYMYADAGAGESTTDLIYAGHNLICENGALLAESKRYATGILCADIDIEKLESERRRMTTFFTHDQPAREIPFTLDIVPLELRRQLSPTPFVPDSSGERAARCEEILRMQAQGLSTRLERSRVKTAVVALSGGLDSTLALIVIARAFDLLSRPRSDIIAITMPGFGTTARTHGNADALAEAFGATLLTIPIEKAVRQHFTDIGHDPHVMDVVYENSQARERTQIAMDIANQRGGLVVGTGDLSELALGWATYNGDHMSMYAVNVSIPKTLVRYLVAYAADQAPDRLADVLRDVLDTPVSPELLPAKDGEISQKTEEIIGPYILHDFFLYYFMRFGFTHRRYTGWQGTLSGKRTAGRRLSAGWLCSSRDSLHSNSSVRVCRTVQRSGL